MSGTNGATLFSTITLAILTDFYNFYTVGNAVTVQSFYSVARKIRIGGYVDVNTT